MNWETLVRELPIFLGGVFFLWILRVLTCLVMTGVLEVRYGFSDYKSDYFPTQKEISPVFTRDNSYSWRLVFLSVLIRREQSSFTRLDDRLVPYSLARNKLLHNYPKVILKVSDGTSVVCVSVDSALNYKNVIVLPHNCAECVA